MKRYIFFVGLSVMIFHSCRKDDTGVVLSLPARTQTGENTFGFLLNESVWTNYGQVCFHFAGGCRENLSGFYYSSDGDIRLDADKVFYKNGSWSTSENISIDLATNFRGIGTFNTLSQDTIKVGYWLSVQGQPQLSYLLSDTNPGFTVTVSKIDTVLGIMSGEFSGTLFRRLSDTSFVTSLTDSIVIREGRFDIKWK